LIKAYPNPVVNNLTLENTAQKAIEEVRIYDSRGRLIGREKQPDFLCTETWTPGTYLLKVTLSDKRMHTIRVVKQ
jgi:hypothetical protein